MRTSLLRFKRVVAAHLVAVLLAGPALAQERVDDLFGALQGADATTVGAIENEIRAIWSKSGSAAMDLLLQRGSDALEAGDPRAAVEHLTALIDHAPDFAEGYTLRATAFYTMGYLGPAMDDIRQALVLEPRHFGAMTGLGVILRDIGQPEDALLAFEEVLRLSPASPDVREAADALRADLDGLPL